MRQFVAWVLGIGFSSHALATPVFYSVDVDTDELVRVDSGTGEVTVIGELGFDTLDIDLASSPAGLFGVDTRFGVRVDLLHINTSTGAVAESHQVQTTAGIVLHAEGLASVNDQLKISYSPEGRTGSPALAEVSLNGLVTGPFVTGIDLDGLGADWITQDLFALDRRIGASLDFFALTESPFSSTPLGSVSDSFRLSDLVPVGDQLYTIDRDDQILLVFDINDQTVNTIPLNRPGNYSGLALVPEPNTSVALLFGAWSLLTRSSRRRHP